MYTINYRMADISICVRSNLDVGVYDHAIPYIVQDTEPDYVFDFVEVNSLHDFLSGARLIYQDYFYSVFVNRGIEFRAFRKNGDFFAVSYLEEKQGYCFFPDKEKMETTIRNGIMQFMFMNIEQIFLKFETFVLHSAQIQYKNDGIAFTAPSGTGKSTQAALWEQEKNAFVVNGDRSAIRKTKQGWKIYGIPMSGSSEIFHNRTSDLKALIVLRQAGEDYVEQIGKKDAFQYLYSECSINYWNRAYVDRMIELLLELTDQVPVYLFHCTKNKSAVACLYSVLYQGQELENG